MPLVALFARLWRPRGLLETYVGSAIVGTGPIVVKGVLTVTPARAVREELRPWWFRTTEDSLRLRSCFVETLPDTWLRT